MGLVTTYLLDLGLVVSTKAQMSHHPPNLFHVSQMESDHVSDIACHKGPFMSTSECEASIGTSLSAIKSDSIRVPPSGEGLLSMDIMSKDAHSSSSRSIVKPKQSPSKSGLR